mgnify:CR=1 FL=1
MARLVIVSNRVPIPKQRVTQAGGLAVALRDILTPGSLWFGWSGRISPDPSPHASQVDARGVTYATVDLTSELHKGFYVGFANGALWPLLHFRLGLLRFRREFRAARALLHPHVVEVYEFVSAEVSYFTMEYVEGTSIAEYFGVEDRRPSPAELKIGRAHV